ncbi:LacI family DNA-binding transcriptional regulator [Chryseomicrobium palamuruense]|uniref:LacI family DNA-binding transcriptional regulator n=1 Tax=Chryseomicrobium palamuruense TaxID=682973 RepID=A0ABV8UUM3_9BACL
MKRKINIKDVAKYAGVSPATVSRVLNNYPHIRPEKRKLVENAIQFLEFKPDEIARSLITKKTNTIGLIVDDISNPFFSEASKIVINQARKLGYEILIYDLSGDIDVEQSLIFLKNRNISGLLVGSASMEEEKFNHLKDSGIPVVYFNRRPLITEFDTVTMDNELASDLAVNHLVSKGHSNIVFISGPIQFSTYFDRLKGFKSAYTKSGASDFEKNILTGAFNEEDIFLFINELFSTDNTPTAVIGASDQIAITILSAISSLKLEVPKDVAVVGFDNISISKNPYIGLTTISQQKIKMLSKALSMLIERIEGNDSENPKHLLISPILIERRTT